MMKTKLLILGVMACLLFSSYQEGEQKCNCKINIDEWVKENKESIEAMSREDFMKLDRSHQIAAFGVFSPSKRAKFIQLKIEELLELDWLAEEREHILYAKHFIESHPQFYEPNWSENKADEELLDKFNSTWQAKGEKEFGWGQAIIYGINQIGRKMIDTKGNLDISFEELSRQYE